MLAFLLRYSSPNWRAIVSTVQDFINTARFQLQDELDQPYRYSNDKLVMGLNISFDEAFRIRPDIFVRQDLPVYSAAALGTTVIYPRGYFMAFVYYMAGFVQMSDQEDTTDSRAATFLNKFISQLTNPQS